MKLTQRLLGYLSRVFNKSPDSVLALRVRYAGGMTWSVADGVLTTAVVGGVGSALVVRLADYTVASLGAFLAAQPGYSVPYVDAATVRQLSALSLIDSAGDQDKSNGDHLLSFTSMLWAYLEGQATELTTARLAIGEAVVQMSASTAEGEWIDEHGLYYGPNRKTGEADIAYSARMVAEVARARGNNFAIALAVRDAVSANSVSITDLNTATVAADSSTSYGLFDMAVSVPIDSPLTGDQINANARSVVEAMRDAGMHMRRVQYAWDAVPPVSAFAFLQVGAVVTVMWGPPLVSWTFDSGGVASWVSNTGAEVGWASAVNTAQNNVAQALNNA